ncbi:MlaD family protein [Epilithonimonas hispanica]|uniref:MCE family protein n=1 Tax=Epilithonimonas hispanica TaxID=358687 RepID=A0A3D9CWT6_9FLAO|nr:MlaD family protein [Epilithonimonas hispanica]REC70108.1 MCE family protein [Epilithonimonas hispanica]
MKLSKELKTGLIAIFTIVSFVVLYQFMKGKNLFTTDNVFYIKYDNVEGLSVSNPVSINGLKVGQVDEIKPITNGGKLHFVVKLTVDDKYEFSKNSTVEIFEPGLMSGKEMKINLFYGGETAKDGDTLKGNYQLSMLNNLSSQVGPVKDQLQSVLKRVDSLTNNANKMFDDRNRAEIAMLLKSLNHTIASYDRTSQGINSLLSNNDPRLQKVLDNANQTMISANSAVDKYGNLAQSIDTKKLNETIANLDATVSSLNTVISSIQKGEGTLGKVMKDEQLYNNLEQTSKNLNELILDLKANPKRYINFSVFGKNSDKK